MVTFGQCGTKQKYTVLLIIKKRKKQCKIMLLSFLKYINAYIVYTVDFYLFLVDLNYHVVQLQHPRG